MGRTDVVNTYRKQRSDEPRGFTVGGTDVTWYGVEAGEGPTLLLLHGTGSSTHSWRTLLPLLAQHYHVVAPDLPGHGRSVLRDDRALTLEGMASAVHDLLDDLDVTPAAMVGHSAGAAVAVQCLLEVPQPDVPIVSLNGAFVPFGGLLGQWFSPLARSLAGSDLVVQAIASRAPRPGAVERLMASTGSSIDRQFMDDYRRLFSSPPHVRATLGMMARWDLWALQSRLPELTAPLMLFYTDRDMTVPPRQAHVTASRVRDGQAHSLGPLGHLAHEEAAAEVAASLLTALPADAHAIN